MMNERDFGRISRALLYVALVLIVGGVILYGILQGYVLLTEEKAVGGVVLAEDCIHERLVIGNYSIKILEEECTYANNLNLTIYSPPTNKGWYSEKAYDEKKFVDLNIPSILGIMAITIVSVKVFNVKRRN